MNKWTDVDVESWFLWHIKTLRDKCDRGEDTTLTVTILMWNILRKVLDMATENRDDHDPRGHFWFFKDPVGLELWPYSRTPYTASIGHRVHGKAMTTGYPPGVEHPHWYDYDEAQDNIVFESQRWNSAKWNYPSSTYPAMIEGLQHLRSGPEMRDIWEIDGQGDGQCDEPPGEEKIDYDSEDEMNLIKQAQFEEEEEEEEEEEN